MSSGTRFPTRWLLTLGAVAITTACSTTNPEAPVAASTTSAAEVAAVALRLAPKVSKALASLRRSTAAFHDVDAAIASGYASPVGLACVFSPAGAMGVHVVKASAMNQAVVPNEPEALLYLPKANGGFKLVAVEYLVPALVRNTTTGAVSPWFPMTPWGAGYTLMTQPPSVFGETFEGPMPGHDPGMPWHYDKHVWIWETNPSGIFSQWNPSISCP